jgi:hypothetical protein
MRLWLVPVLASVCAFTRPAFAADDDLPTGSEPPKPTLVGVIDGYYAWHDVPPPVRQSTTMSTASRHDEFSVNLAAIGVRLDHAKLTGNLVLQVGDSVDRVYGDHRLRYVQLANVGWKTGIVHLEAGVMPSLVGRESFISTENWSYTRSFIADATPFYVGGARITARVSPTFLLGATVFNGWQTYRAGTQSPHGQLFTTWRPSDAFSIDATVLVGPTQLDSHVIRTFADVVLTWNPHPRVGVALEGWAARENGYEALIDATTRKKDPWAYGGVLSARWKFGDTVWVAGRAEALRDDGGFITGTGDRSRVLPPAGQDLLGGTFTFGWQPHPNLVGKVEALQRYASEEFFAGEQGSIKKRATTFSVSAALSF